MNRDGAVLDIRVGVLGDAERHGAQREAVAIATVRRRVGGAEPLDERSSLSAPADGGGPVLVRSARLEMPDELAMNLERSSADEEHQLVLVLTGE